MVAKGLLIIPELTKYDHCFDDEIIPETFLDHGKIEKKNWHPMQAYDLAGSLIKVGRSTKMWVSRWHVLTNHIMYIFDSKYSNEPNHIIYLRGLYFE